MEIRVTESTRSLEPPPIRNARLDWHALEFDEQDHVEQFRLSGEVPKSASVRVRKFIERHC